MDKFQTYHFLRKGSLFLSIALVGCADNFREPFVPETTPTRPLAENVRLVPEGLPTDADTRLGYEAGDYNFEAGDTLAACLMDLPNGAATANPDAGWYDKYTLIGNINTNYPFVRDGQGTWSSSAKLSEGNYFFMFPYSNQYGSRRAYIHTLKPQTLKDGTMASLMRLYAEGNFFVGYAPIKEGTSNNDAVHMSMRPVFGALGITLRNESGKSRTLRRIAVRNPDGGFLTTVVVNPTTCTYATDNGMFNIAQYTGDDSDAGRANGYEENRKDYSRPAALDDLVKPLPGQAPAEKVEVRITDGAEIPAAKEQRLLVMLPQGKYEDLLLEVETDEGTARNLLLEGETSIAVDRKAHRTVSLKDEDFSSLPATSASATDDLARLIHWNVNVPTVLTASLQADVRITAAMYKELRDGMPELLQIHLNGHSLVLEEDVDETALCGKLECLDDDGSEGRVIVTGRQVLNKEVGAAVRNDNELQILGGNGLRIENRGTLTVSGEVAQAAISNAGTMVIEPGASVNGNVTVETGGILLNHGTLDGLTNAGRLTNRGELQGEGNTGILRNLTGEVRLEENTGYVHAEGSSATVITANGNSTGPGILVITRLAPDGNIKVESDQKGHIVQELEGDRTTAEIRLPANTLWLHGRLSGVKDAQGNAQVADLTRYTVVATGTDARLDNEGAEMKIGAMQIRAGASLTIYRTDVECPSVRLQGDADAPAKLVISNLSNLYGTSGAATEITGNGTGYNEVKDFGGERNRIHVSGL